MKPAGFSNGNKISPILRAAIIVTVVLGLHLLVLGLISPHDGKTPDESVKGPVTISGKHGPSPGAEHPSGLTPKDEGSHKDAPNMVKSSYGIDPYIQKLRRELLPESFTDAGGPPRIKEEMDFLKKAVEKDPKNKELLYLASWNCLMREDYDEFFPYCQRLLQLDPRNFRGLQIKSNAYYNMGRYPLAIENAKKALQINPDDGFTHYILGSSHLLGANDAKKAIPILAEAIRLNPELPFAYGSLGQCYFEIGGPENINRGIQVFTEGIEKFPDHQLTFVLMAEDYLYNTGDLEKTIGLTNRILELNPRSFQAHLMKGCLLMNMGRYADAEQSFIKGEKAGPQYKFLAEIQVCLGQSVYRQGRSSEAQKYFEKAVEIQHDNPDANLYRSDACVGLALIYLDRGELTKSKEMLDRALESYPDNLNQVVVRVDWYLSAGDGAGAEAFLKKAANHSGNRMYLKKVLVEFLWAKIRESRGDRKKAQFHLLASLKSAPDYLKKLVDRTARTDRHLSELFKDPAFSAKFESIERHRRKNFTQLK